MNYKLFVSKTKKGFFKQIRFYILLSVPGPMAVNCTDDQWRWFKNCLETLDGTYIEVRVPKNS